jgi:hypothetical protein
LSPTRCTFYLRGLLPAVRCFTEGAALDDDYILLYADIAIITPYNGQVDAIKKKLAEADDGRSNGLRKIEVDMR